jgi:Ubiquitin-like autophagy protein Apg12
VTRIVDMSIAASVFVLLFSVVVVRFKAVGNAPIMKQNFFRVTVSNHFQAVIQFLRRELGWKAGDPLVSERYLFSPVSPPPSALDAFPCAVPLIVYHSSSRI